MPVDLLLTNPERWLRWQLTQRGGLLWHETCATCQYWDPDELPQGAGAYGVCHNVRVDHHPHAGDACSDYHERMSNA
jgi:hypothetical protein